MRTSTGQLATFPLTRRSPLQNEEYRYLLLNSSAMQSFRYKYVNHDFENVVITTDEER